MANFVSLVKRLYQLSLNNLSVRIGQFVKQRHDTVKILKTGVGLTAVGFIVYSIKNHLHSTNVVYAAKPRKRDFEIQKAVTLTMRERRFIKFASVEYDGQLYMTPQDFLDSVVESEPRPRDERRVLARKELEVMKNATPLLRGGSSHLFRTLKDKGIVSYTEYLFLLSILTKPQTGFRIAFNMFDTDGNERVDKKEFLVIKKIFGYGLKDRCLDVATQRDLQVLLIPSEEALSATAKLREHQELTIKTTSNSYMENIFSHAWRGRHGGVQYQLLTDGKLPETTPNIEEDDQGLQRRHAIDTSLMIHFFGKDGNTELTFDGFRQFMENLQYEVLELEFGEFSKGKDTISELDFAKILLRYMYLDTDEYEMYLQRLLDRSKHRTNITFHEFWVFYQFLNSLDDFSIAMRMYTLANHPISKDEFMRAVKICTGTYLSEHIIDTVFALFDVDGDGQLSYEEFIAFMKDRLHRGIKTQSSIRSWKGFKYCVKRDFKGP